MNADLVSGIGNHLVTGQLRINIAFVWRVGEQLHLRIAPFAVIADHKPRTVGRRVPHWRNTAVNAGVFSQRVNSDILGEIKTRVSDGILEN